MSRVWDRNMRYLFPSQIRPELHLLSEQPPAVRSQLVSKSRTDAMKDWRLWIFYVALLLPFAICASSLRVMLGKSGVSSLIPSVMCFGCLPVSWLWMEWKLVPKYLRRRMVEHGIELCISCGYDLRGSKDRCPECGHECQASESSVSTSQDSKE